MSTIITIDGGFGRALTAMPSLLYYAKEHQNDEFYVVIHGWDYITWGFPELQSRTFNAQTKGLFENYFWNAEKIITPEPYRIPAYYRNEISLISAFHQEINQKTDDENLPDTYVKLSQFEILKGHEIVETIKSQSKKEKTIVIQPYGSTANRCPMGVFDPTFRSIPQEVYETLVKRLSQKYNVIYMGAVEFHDEISYKPQPDPNMREWMGIIQVADYFIGCDSCGQHMAKAVGTRASVFIGGTHKNNVSYPNDFHIIERDVPFYSAPMRICDVDSTLATRLNEERIKFTNEEIDVAYEQILERIEGKPKTIQPEKIKNKAISYT